MNYSVLNEEPKYLTGWRLAPFLLKFSVSLGKYIFQRKKYPLFLLNSLNLKGKNKEMARLRKIVKFGKQHYAIIRVPHWPSKAFDHMVANGGLNIKALGTRLKSQIDYAILAITRKCKYRCTHCYESFNLSEEESIPIEQWKEVMKELQSIGVNIIVFSGGEPMLRWDELVELLEYGDKNLSDFHIHTSGHGVTLNRAIALKNAGLTAAGIAIDDFDPEMNDSFKGYHGAYKESAQAIRYFRRAGIFPYINTCLRKELIRSGKLWKYYEAAKGLNVGAIFLLEPRPCGRYMSENMDDLFSENDRMVVTEFFKDANQSKKYKDYPLVAYMNYFERPGHLGCLMGGLSHFYIDSLGNVQPCVFLPISFGNIMEKDFLGIYKRMRKDIPGPIHRKCPSLFFAEKIRVRMNQGMTVPIPFERVERDWQKMFAESEESDCIMS